MRKKIDLIEEKDGTFKIRMTLPANRGGEVVFETTYPWSMTRPEAEYRLIEISSTLGLDREDIPAIKRG